MGIDTADLVLAIEASFGVELADDELARLRTLGDVHRVLVRRLQPYQPGACLSSAVFYRVRRALRDVFGVEGRDVAPAAPLDGLLPAEGRIEGWRRFHAAVGLPAVPALRPPDWAGCGLALLTGFLILAGVVCGLAGALLSGFLLLMPAVLMPWLAERATAPLADRLPSDCTTVRGLVQTLLAFNYAFIAEAVHNSNPAELLESLRRVVGDWADADPGELTPSTLIQDLT
jgi:hypothetical protein